jgi:predicted amidophosphoribosyltransferase
MLLPTSCPVCRRVGRAPCADCSAALRPAPDLPTPPGVDQCVSLLAYEGPAAVAIRRLKYANHRDALGPFARTLSDLVVEATAGAAAFHRVTWVPAARAHRRERGYDQGALIARAVGRRLGLRAQRLLVRADSRSQTGSSLARRLDGPALAAVAGARVAGPVLVVDDVRTSGASLSAAAFALRAVGASHVVAATLAATPDRSAT